MSSMVDIFQDGGPFMYVVLLAALAGPMVVLLAIVAGMVRVRVPAVVWFLVPLAAILLGAVGTLLSLGLATEAIAYASAEMKGVLGHAGYAAAILPESAGLFVAGGLLGLGVWGAGISAAADPGEEPVTTVVPAIIGGGVAAAGGLALIGWGLLAHSGMAGVAAGGTLLLCAPAVVLGGARSGTTKAELARQAEHRLALLLCLTGAVVCIAGGAWLSGQGELHRSIAHASPELRGPLSAVGVFASQHALRVGPAATLIAAISGGIALLPVAPHLASGRTFASIVLIGLGLLACGGLGGVQYSQLDRLRSFWPELALIQVYQTHPDLPGEQAWGGEPGSGTGVSLPEAVFERQGGAWQTVSLRGAPADAVPLPLAEGAQLLLLTQGSDPADAIARTAWTSGAGAVEVLTQRGMPPQAADEPWLAASYVHAVPLTWFPAEQPPIPVTDETVVVLRGEDAGAVTLAIPAQDRADRLARLEDAAQALAAVLERGDNLSTLYLVPGSGWSVQDLVSLCNTARTLQYATRCHITEALTLPAPRRPEVVAQADGGADAESSSGTPSILGALDRELIEAVVRRHSNQIRYCYQRELTKDPSLSGTLKVKFVIAADGSVSTAQVEESTVGHAGLESCVVGRFMRMMFPEPQGGGIVVVRYPFTFAPG